MEKNINHHQTFGNGAAGQKISDILRHLVSEDDKKIAICGAVADTYAMYRYYAVATRIEHAQVCEDCVSHA